MTHPDRTPLWRSTTARLVAAAVSVLALALGLMALPAQAVNIHIDTFTRTDLASDQMGKAQITDPNLMNVWGMSDGASPLWVSNNGKDNSTLYSGDVGGSPFSIVPLVVSIPGGKPTGQVFNGGGGFNVKNPANNAMLSSVFIFVGQTGQITGWNPGLSPITSAVNGWTTPGADYTGTTIVSATAGRELLAANFSAGTVDVFDSNFMPVQVQGAFVDKFIPKDFAPFNVAALNGQVYVTYAKQKKGSLDDDPGIGHGFIDVFTNDGKFVKRLVTVLGLNSPWGLTIAPTGFGDHTGDLLVANHGSGLIGAYDAMNGRFKGFLLDQDKKFIVINGLFGLLNGNGVAGDPSSVLFSAGPDKGQHGLVGRLALNQASTSM
jgi:uncharacterized protein (TIGR03118 family)